MSEFSGILDEFSELFTTIEHHRKVKVEGDLGDYWEWNLIGTFEGVLRPLSGDKQLSADKETFYSDHVIYCDPREVQEGDHFKVDNKYYKSKFPYDVMNTGDLMKIETELTGHEVSE